MLHTPAQPPVSANNSDASSHHHGINTPTGGNQFRPPTVNMSGKYAIFLCFQNDCLRLRRCHRRPYIKAK